MSMATLGFSIDSSQATGAAADLDRLTAAATRTQGAADKLEAEASGLGAALGAAGAGAAKAKPAVDNLGKSFVQQDDHVKAFRMEVDRLTLKYQPLAAATSKYAATVSEIERAHKLGAITAQQMTSALDRERLAFERLKTSATTAGAAVKAANMNSPRGMGNERAAGINAGYQTQDILVSALGGQSAGLIGFQQGSQLAAAVSTMERPVAGLVGAFASLLSPVNLVTVGLVAGTAALIQYGQAWFTSGGDDISGDLEAQAELIYRVAERWGDATPALKAYADQLARTTDAQELQQAITLRTGQEYEKIAGELTTFADRYSDFVAVLTAASNVTGSQRTAISDLGTAYYTLQERIESGKATIQDFDRVREAATRAAAMEGAEELGVFRSGMDDLTQSTAAARDELQKLQRDKAIALNSAHPSRGTYPGVLRSPDGTIQNNPFLPPDIGPVPGRRPLRELEGDGTTEAANILNSDGRLVGVPIPGQKPNVFELEKEVDAIDDVTKAYRRAQEAQAEFWLDLSFQERQAGRNAVDQRVAVTLGRYGFDENMNSPEANAIRQQINQGQTKAVVSDFFSAVHDGAWENGGKIGKAIGEAALQGLQSISKKLWENIFDSASNAIANLITGGSGASPAAGVVSNIAGAVANDNKSFSAPVGAVMRAGLPAVGDMGAYREAIASIESRGSGGYSALGPITRNGDRAYGRYQMMGNNIGPWSKSALGRSISSDEFMANPGLQDKIFDHRFGSYVDKYGAGGAAQAWFGGPGSVGKGGGAADMLGTTGTAYVDKFTKALDGASGDLGKFGGGLSKLGEGLSTSFFPAAPTAPGGGGGIGGWLSGLFGGGLSAATIAKYTPLTGLFANGTNYAPGGMAMVGERGPELVNLPQGSGVVSNHKLISALAANNNGGQGSGIAGIRVFVDKDGNWDAKVESIAMRPARQASSQAVGQYSKQQTRGGFGDTQAVYASDKG